jgi:hypothetical protein
MAFRKADDKAVRVKNLRRWRLCFNRVAAREKSCVVEEEGRKEENTTTFVKGFSLKSDITYSKTKPATSHTPTTTTRSDEEG